MYKPGKTVIVTQDDVNRVGVVLDVYDRYRSEIKYTN